MNTKNFKSILLFALSIVLIQTACQKKDEVDPADLPTSTWLLKEVLADPGSGGTFQAVTSNKKIEFFSNGTVLCEGNLCDMSLGTTPNTIGNYSDVDSTISSSACNNDIKYSVQGNTMILTYQCIEACQAKYTKQ